MVQTEKPLPEAPPDSEPPKPGAPVPETELLTKGRGVGEEEGDPQVADMQNTLASMGTCIGDGEPDGRFGPETEKAVKRVQHRLGLKPDSIVAPKSPFHNAPAA